MELYWRDTLTVPTEAEYLQMISHKTGGLFRLALRLMRLVSESDCNVLPLAEVIGLIFQIQDDYKNVSSDQVSLSPPLPPRGGVSTKTFYDTVNLLPPGQMTAAKGYCEDLTEGKFSFPVIHAIKHSESGNSEILNILKSHTEDDAVKAHAVLYMKNITKSFDYTRDVLRRLHAQALALMDALGGPRSLVLETILNKLIAD